MEHELGPLPKTEWHLYMPPTFYEEGWESYQSGYTEEDMRAYALAEVRKAVAVERERCARLVETQDTNGDHVGCWFELLAEKIRVTPNDRTQSIDQD